MIATISVREKSFGNKQLMSDVSFAIEDGEKIGLIGRNGVGKSTLFAILAGQDTEYTGEIIFRKGIVAAATAQEHHGLGDQTVLEYVLHGLPEYAKLSHILRTYPDTMGDNIRLIHEYTHALDRYGEKGFYHIEDVVREELKTFQLEGTADRPFQTLSGGQKRLVEVVKIMHSDADLALIDEPTNHMDYVAKAQFIDWMKSSSEAMLVITHDRDVLREVDRIVELRDGTAVSYDGNYDKYLSQNAFQTQNAMGDYEMVERRIANLKAKVLQFRRYKEKARDPDTIKQFKRREEQAAKELAELQTIEKPTFWIDRESVEQLDFKAASKYERFKTRNIRVQMRTDGERSTRTIVQAKNLALGYGDTILFEDVDIDLRAHEAAELRGRNGAGKTTIIRALLGTSGATVFDGTLHLDPRATVGVYEQEISERYLALPLAEAIEQMYLDRDFSISHTKVRQLMSDYLFVENDAQVPLSQLSGGQKARFQLISMLAGNPDLLILDEPTNHLDLPSIEEIEHALERYSGAILYVSHDTYFREKLGGTVVQVGKE